MMHSDSTVIGANKRILKYDIIKIVFVALVVIGHASYNDRNTTFDGVHIERAMNAAGIADTLFSTPQ